MRSISEGISTSKLETLNCASFVIANHFGGIHLSDLLFILHIVAKSILKSNGSKTTPNLGSFSLECCQCVTMEKDDNISFFFFFLG